MHPEFPSDIHLLLETVGARLIVAEGVDQAMEVSVQEFMRPEMDMKKRVLLKVCLPAIKAATNQVLTYKVSSFIFPFLIRTRENKDEPRKDKVFRKELL